MKELNLIKFDQRFRLLHGQGTIKAQWNQGFLGKQSLSLLGYLDQIGKFIYLGDIYDDQEICGPL